MRKLLLIGSILLVLGLLVIGFATPIFAHSPDDGEITPANGGAWEAMHEACEEGDWEAMAEWHAQCYGEEGTMNGGMMRGGMMGGGMGGHMGRGMMGW